MPGEDDNRHNQIKVTTIARRVRQSSQAENPRGFQHRKKRGPKMNSRALQSVDLRIGSEEPAPAIDAQLII